MPAAWRGQRIVLRIGSAVYGAKLWIDGKLIGGHEGGNLPFAFDITGAAAWDQPMTIALRVDNTLLPERVPPTGASDPKRAVNVPDVTFDFFPYSGLHRAAFLYTLPPTHIGDITVTTAFEGPTGVVRVQATASGSYTGPGRAQIGSGGDAVSAPLAFRDGAADATLRIDNVRAWGPGDPHPYALAVGIGPDAEPTDGYALDIGVRTVEVCRDKLLLNGRPIMLRGAARHEDFAINGRGLTLPVAVRDLQQIHWIGGNSFRTSHYPYAEETMQMADRLGILVIDEIPAVGLFFSDSDDRIAARLAQCKQDITELVARDKNHPSAIVWSLANEPMNNRHAGGNGIAVPSDDGFKAKGSDFFKALFAHARTLDSTRPFGFVQMIDTDSSWNVEGDLNMVNR